MNDVQQVLAKPHPQTNVEHTWQGNTECWSLILDEGLLQVENCIYCAILIDNEGKIYYAITSDNYCHTCEISEE